MQSFHRFFLKEEAQTFRLDMERWFVFDESSQNEIKVSVKLRNSYTLRKGHYFKAVRPTTARYYITDRGNVDFFERGIFVEIEDERVLSEHIEEEEAMRASELSFKGFQDPEGENFDDKYADRLDDIGLPHK